ncbi:MAG: GNAT family N-acetyltransferase [Bacteroidales bacterium]|nr:GNAT family N-acetyltransferase [Bacteroidales bacterium]
MSIQIVTSAGRDLHHLRRERFYKLPEPQELFLELMVRSSTAYIIFVEDEEAGYCYRGNEDDLTELHIHTPFLPLGGQIFSSVLKNLDIKYIWCQTFDRNMAALCTEKNFTYEVVGCHYRERLPGREIDLPGSIEVRPAAVADLEKILEKDDSFFESREEAEMIFNQEHLLYFHQKEEFIGCGTVMQVFGDSRVYDIGMLVSPEHRQKGYGAAIISYLASYCESRGWRPIAGCAIDNIGSRKTLEKAGFVSRDRLLRFFTSSQRSL